MIGPVGASWAVEALIASSVLMVLVLLLRGPVRRAFGAHVAYALWALPVLRLALPPLPGGWHVATKTALHQAAVADVLRAAEPVTMLLAAPVVRAEAAHVHAWILPLLGVPWVIGAAGFFAWHALSHRRFCARLLASVGQRAELDGVSVIESGAASGPLAFGVVRRYVAFPRDFAERYDPEERDLALAHEMGHHERGDLIANWIALGVLALHWFNPIAWRAFRAFRADQEIANDARVLAGMNPMRRHTYACAIVKAAHPALYGSVAATCHLNTVDDLKGRLRMLTTRRTSRLRLASGGVAIAALTLGGLALTASGSAAAERMRSGVKHATGVDIAALVVPAAPAVPAALATEGMAQNRAVDALAVTPAMPRQTTSGAAPETPQAPIAPIAPTAPTEPLDAAPPAPAAPPSPPLPPEVLADGAGTYLVTTDRDGKRIVRHGRYVKLGSNGQATMIGEDGMATSLPIPPRTPAVPEMRSLACGAGTRMTIEDEHDGRRRITLCTDRIAAASARGAAAAARGAQLAANGARMQHDAYAHALVGLRATRARMMANRDMPADARRHTLDGIDTAIAELEANLSRLP
ncbi:M56 family metallopeptidase [Sphingomonas sp. CARO-RG-8B-R24-01]|uniref:M56 family metallopeptidase n=1 Tax=Sphingomonas sp. CARO-RG-8B-R24-01 TaxID=2914831 RepID=UPI001F58C85C|nr:M56 family metallopeptidase [Sphingomonas sp. CARO-RG-8B-R24-01]